MSDTTSGDLGDENGHVNADPVVWSSIDPGVPPGAENRTPIQGVKPPAMSNRQQEDVGAFLEEAQGHEPLSQVSKGANKKALSHQNMQEATNEPPFTSKSRNTEEGSGSTTSLTTHYSSHHAPAITPQRRATVQDDNGTPVSRARQGRSRETTQLSGARPSGRDAEDTGAKNSSSSSNPLEPAGETRTYAPMAAPHSLSHAETPAVMANKSNQKGNTASRSVIKRVDHTDIPTGITGNNMVPSSPAYSSPSTNADPDSTVMGSSKRQTGPAASPSTTSPSSTATKTSRVLETPQLSSEPSSTDPPSGITAKFDWHNKTKVKGPSALPATGGSPPTEDHSNSTTTAPTESNQGTKNSAPQVQKSWTLPNSKASAATPQQQEDKGQSNHQQCASDDNAADSSYSPTRGAAQNPVLPASKHVRSTTVRVSPTTTYPTPPVSPIPAAGAPSTNLTSIAGGQMVDDAPEAVTGKGKVLETSPVPSSSGNTMEALIAGERPPKSPVLPPAPNAVYTPGYGAKRQEVIQSPNAGTSHKQNQGIIAFESIVVDHKSLDLSSELETKSDPGREGRVAVVHVGYWRQRKVAIKVIKRHENWRVEIGASNDPHIATEVPIWAALKHKNICEFLGYSTKFGAYPALVSEWCEGKTSLEYLRGQHLPVERRIKLAQGVAEGLQYLHKQNIVHGDLTPTNVLVDDAGVAKISDVGLTRLTEWQRLTMITSPYTGGQYRAPEVFITAENCHPRATSAGDIYSFGCLLLYFIEQVHPFRRFRIQDVMRQILARNPPAVRDSGNSNVGHMKDFFWSQLEACWDDPLRRPNIENVVEALGTLAANFPLVRSNGPTKKTTEDEDIKNPPPKYSPGEATLPRKAKDHAGANYSSDRTMPDQGPVQVNIHVGNAIDLMARAFRPGTTPSKEGKIGEDGQGQFSKVVSVVQQPEPVVYGLPRGLPGGEPEHEILHWGYPDPLPSAGATDAVSPESAERGSASTEVMPVAGNLAPPGSSIAAGSSSGVGAKGASGAPNSDPRKNTTLNNPDRDTDPPAEQGRWNSFLSCILCRSR